MAPRAGPLRAIAIRPQVALPACRALLTLASLADAHLPTVTTHPAVPMVTRPADRHMPTPGWLSRYRSVLRPWAAAPGREARQEQAAHGRLPRSGEQRRVGSRDRRTPTVPLTLRDQAFDSGEARNPAVRRGHLPQRRSDANGPDPDILPSASLCQVQAGRQTRTCGCRRSSDEGRCLRAVRTA